MVCHTELVEVFYKPNTDMNLEQSFTEANRLGKLRIENQEKAIQNFHDTKRINEIAKKICVCINWHPSTKPDQGKKAICSYCNRPRQ